MRYWVTHFPLPEPTCSALTKAGLQPWSSGESALPVTDSLLLYDSPDQLIASVGIGPESDTLTPFEILRSYRSLLNLSAQTGQPLMAISHLQRLEPHVLSTLIEDGTGAPSFPPPLLPIPTLLASVTLTLLEAEPALLDCYCDLELRAVLLGREPDLRYGERLRQAGQDGDALLQAFLASQRVQAAATELEQRLVSRDMELQEAREESELLLLQLHQVHQDLEDYFLADVEKQRRLEARDREFEALRERLEPRLADFEKLLAIRDMELQEAREESELSLLQLHRVNEDLEHYFLADVEKQRRLEARDREFEALRERLEPRLADFEKLLAIRDMELQEAREESELSLLQLHRVNEDLEHYFLADVEKQRRLEGRDREFESLRERLESRLADLEKLLASRDTDLQEARETAQLNVLQLHQVQEELERYFLKARASDQLAQAQLEQLQRAQRVIVRLSPTAPNTAVFSRALAVQVLPEQASALPNPTLQTEALLSTYATSLQRASALLERARSR